MSSSTPLHFSQLAKSYETGQSSTNPSPQLVTPHGTPPNPPPMHFSEAKLHSLLSNFDLHTFDRTERETLEERKMSIGGEVPLPAGSRRPSFLSSLSLTRPSFSFASNPNSAHTTPAQTPISGSFAHGFTMTPAAADESAKPIVRAQSATALPQQSAGTQQLPAQMQRSNTAPQGHPKISGFAPGETSIGKQKIRGMTHFDPSKEPRLLSLL